MSGLLGVLLWVGISILVLILLLFLFRCWRFGNFIVRNFRRCNVVVDGKKGSGKDLLFQYVINKRDEHYYSNISYGGKHTPITPKLCSIAPNTYEQFITGDVKPLKERFYENEDFYFSDGGTFFPNYVDGILNRSYPSLPLMYALSRHICDSNIHVNVQNCGRLWKKLREQADFFIHCVQTIKLPFHLLIHCYTYDKESSALQNLRPVRKRMFNKFDKAEKDIYEAQNGDIRSGWVIVRKKNIKYDTRAFEKLVYGDLPRRSRKEEEREAERKKREEARKARKPSLIKRLLCKVRKR